MEVYLTDRPNKAQKPHPQKQLLEITFGKDDAQWVQHPHDDLLVVTLALADYTIHRVLIDNGSSADILYAATYDMMQFGGEKLQPVTSPLIGFAADKVHPIGTTDLPVTAKGMVHHHAKLQ
jgi:hypothetical protein